jgi:hypothetical protein
MKVHRGFFLTLNACKFSLRVTVRRFVLLAGADINAAKYGAGLRSHTDRGFFCARRFYKPG